MKIKLTSKEKNINGTFKKKVVFPYGNSARIPEQKSNIGKKVYVIYPSKAYYSWVFSDDELKTLLKKAKINIKNYETKHYLIYENAIKSLESNRFRLNDIRFVLDLIATESEMFKLHQKITKMYLKK